MPCLFRRSPLPSIALVLTLVVSTQAAAVTMTGLVSNGEGTIGHGSITPVPLPFVGTLDTSASLSFQGRTTNLAAGAPISGVVVLDDAAVGVLQSDVSHDFVLRAVDPLPLRIDGNLMGGSTSGQEAEPAFRDHPCRVI